MEGEVDVAQLYRRRFSDRDLRFKAQVWEVLCSDYFQRWVRGTDTVVDLGAGTCEFINAIQCGEKIAVDINPEIAEYARGAKVLLAPSTDLGAIDSESVDVVFCSNFFEHLPNKAVVLQTLAECNRILRPGGRIIVMQPNIRYVPGRYWDYFDHYTPLTHVSMVEALELSRFSPQVVKARFLPFAIKGTRLPRLLFLLRLYLRLPFLWRLFGQQMLIVATPS